MSMEKMKYVQARTILLEQITSTLQKDERFVAAWLAGSFGRGEERCCHRTWWIIRFPAANPLLVGFFVMVPIEEAIFSWREGPSDFFCCYFHHPRYARTVQLHLAVVALKRKAAARGKRASRTPSIVGWFCQRPWLGYAADSVAPPACHLALVAARAQHGVIREDAQNDSRHATTPGELTGVGTAEP